MNAGTLSAVVIATLAILAAAGGGMSWLYRRGRDEQSLSNSVEQHARATGELAAQVGKLSDKLESHGSQLVDHEYRLRAGGL